MQQFVNLYQYSEYTMLGSTAKISRLIAMAAAAGCEALAISDLNNMHGTYKFYTHCHKAGIKPIIGINVTCESLYNFYNSILLYAKGEDGYKNLLIIASRVKEKGEVDLEFLKKHSYDLLLVLPGDENDVIKLYNEGNREKAKLLSDIYRNIFPDTYLGITLQSKSTEQKIDDYVDFAAKLGLKAVALHKTMYLTQDDFTAYQVLRCIDLGINEYRFSEKEENGYFPTAEAIFGKFGSHPELIAATREIAGLCNVSLGFEGFRLPIFPDADGNSFKYLSELGKFGLNKRLKNRRVEIQQYKARLLYELDVINKMGFCDYFLIVYDFVRYAKKNDILVGPGRGSAPGSLVSYALGITDIDPIEHDLLFERFLNPERITMPDIDIDFPDNKRDKVIRYVLNKYGNKRVAHISTFGTFGVRLAIRDIARVYKFSDVEVNEVLKYIPAANIGLDAALRNNEMFRDLASSNARVGRLVDVVRRIEGLPRHISTHAAGIIMADDDLINYTALQPGMNGLYQTQYEADDLSALGLVKFDFLGLKNLSIIEEVVAQVKEENPEFDLSGIPLDDHLTYRMIAAGDTDGIFQLESSGMRKVLIGLKASRFIDIVHANALYRPGPMAMIPSFIRRKFREEEVDYIHPDLKGILEPTYGTIVFQEQIMMIVRAFAGYSLGMADILRRAVTKKDARLMAAERTRFVEGSKRMGHDQDLSNKVYDYIVSFANYGFNKSHSVAYSFIAYQMAYLKRRYYRHFMATLMSHSIGSIAMIKGYINDLRKKGVVVHPPSVNKSAAYFRVIDKGIYYSLLGIQNLGAVTAGNLLSERAANGAYRDYREFVMRTANIINRRIIDYMIWAGALDDFALPRKQMAEAYERTLDFVRYRNLFDSEELIAAEYGEDEYSYSELSAYEREALGFNLQHSLFARFQQLILKEHMCYLAELPIGNNIKTIFAVRSIRQIITKNNQEMAFVQIYDDSDEIDAVIFPADYGRYKNILAKEAIYQATGKTEMRDNKKQYIIKHLSKLR